MMKRWTAGARLLWVVFIVGCSQLVGATRRDASRRETCRGGETSESRFASVVVPFLKQHCTDCHSGEDAEAELSLDQYQQSANIQTDYERWERVRLMLIERQMPPSDEPQPSQAEVHACIEAIDAEMDSFDCEASQTSGTSHHSAAQSHRIQQHDS